MSSEKKQKPKPPRPPAPNLGSKKNIQKQAASGFSFSFNDLKSVDSDDDSENSFVEFAKPNTQDVLSSSKKPKELQSMTNADSKTKEMKPLSSSKDLTKNGETHSLGSEEDFYKYNEAIRPPEIKSSVVTKPVAVEQVQKVTEEVQRSSPPTKSRVNRDTGLQNETVGKIKPKLTKVGSGVLKVATEVLEEKENEAFKLPYDSQEALADPLSFLDKVMEDQLDISFEDEEDSGSRGSLRRNESGGSINSLKKKTLQQQRTKSLDVEIGQGKDSRKSEENSLDINPCYFNVPTPSELKDEPVKRSDSISSLKGNKKAQAKVVSLSELLASKNVAEDDGEQQSIAASSDGLRTPETAPNDSDWVKIERKPRTDSPPPSSSQAQSPVEEVKTAPQDWDVPLPPLPFYTLHLLTFLAFLYYLFPLPTYLSGFLTGLFCSFYLVLFLIWINLPPRDRFLEEEEEEENASDDPLVIPGPRMTAAKVRSKEQEKVALKGWMNELAVPYDQETYHVNQTHSVYVRLEGHTLRLSRPKQSIARRAMFDEPTPRPEFVHQRIYDIRGSYIYLQPEGLVKKRLWSKKYPLCIELPKKGVSIEKKDISPNDDAAQSLGFDVVKKDECDDKVLVLFARTSREKEEWFWKFDAAARSDKITSKVRPIQTLHKKVFLVGNDFLGEDGSPIYRVDPEDMGSRKSMVDFYKFLSKIMPKEKDVTVVQDVKAKAGGVTYANPGPRLGGPSKGLDGPSPMGAVGSDAPVAWVNAFIGRFFWDFLREERWADIIQAKLQKKLSKIKIPHFMEALTITGTDLGLNAPTIRKVSRPTVDARGMWVDLDVHYGGSCWMTLTTKFNLWKLGKDSRMEREMEDMMSGRKEGIEKLERRPRGTCPHSSSEPVLRRQTSAALDSDEEDSAESSDDEPEDTPTTTSADPVVTPEEGLKSSSKILRFVNKVANSNYFQRATQNKFVKRAFDEVSNTSVELTVEVKELRGVLAVNIPPPPSDRLWYGFRGKPRLWLSAKPKLGSRQVTITHITEYIERKLEKEFQKVFVLPNMDDIPVPIMEFKVEEHQMSR